MQEAIHAEGLTRRFGKVLAVDRVNFNVRVETITAFLGPNGAGKTTTISLLLGLIKPQSGNCEVLGYPPGHPRALSQLGAMVESPSLYDHLTGLENVEITRLMRDAPRTETDRVLSMVGLLPAARRPVRTYSLGMKQRLGLALALMGEPKLLILDEPTNGLDPAGIQEIRELIRSLPRDFGATVFLSSHILAEIEQVAADVVVIHRGQIRYQGPMEALGTPGPSQLQVRVEEPLKAIGILQAGGFRSQQEEHFLRVDADPTQAPEIASLLVAQGLRLFELTPRKVNLEARFMALLEGE